MWDFTFAMAAPRGIELNQDKFVVSDSSLEVIVGEHEDPLLLGDLGPCHGPKNSQHNQELHLLGVFDLQGLCGQSSSNCRYLQTDSEAVLSLLTPAACTV